MHKFDIGSEVVATVNFFQPDEEHGMTWFPKSGDLGEVVAVFQLDNGDVVYDVEFEADVEPGSWPMAETEIAFRREIKS